MTEEQERKILREVVKRVEGTNPVVITRPWFNWALWIACVLILLFVLQWYELANHPAIPLVGGGMVGIVVGVIIVMQSGEKNWSVVKKYIDTPAIKEKLDNSGT